MAKRSAFSEGDSNTVPAITVLNCIGFISEKEILNNKVNPLDLNRKKSTDLMNPTGTMQAFTEYSEDDSGSCEHVCTQQTQEVAKFLGHFIVGYIVYGETKYPVTKDPYASVLRKVADETLVEYQNHFNQYIATLDLDNDNNRFSTLCRVFDHMLSGQPTWGRIVVLFCFGGWLAKHTTSRPIAGKSMAEETGAFLGNYVAGRLGRWIDDQGGWDKFVDMYGRREKKTISQLGGKQLTVAALLTATAASVYFYIS